MGAKTCSACARWTKVRDVDPSLGKCGASVSGAFQLPEWAYASGDQADYGYDLTHSTELACMFFLQRDES